ncbi:MULTISPECIES: MurR/RpiR family transcriptional regulator [Aerococcus]|uniref:MurR/RpiR family transcriptional regulator n=1 Tax=Aerococcus TaxID=1375 RepID=UPI000DCEC42D|nr:MULTISPECIES: MurR/RpiR family transcriptional regulator [Aerococcus]KAA9297502.1 MurR/RpiR family transcriptional regulator [Aerococcus tenax]MDK6688165.1 MurR/RpiR family transcriptional regulator [Aerococcus urinae]MDK8132715.1 MurR/RpiR family transcriptional regulator [Aerococcus urinae]MDK8484364.1 MurR/RpiR family transcriptional regulator [Aerococcus urinae]MDL5179353.1 MurR/RpiR family transcriptional regulator [Aerococcus tenax]
MLIKERLDQVQFSPAEQNIVKYILENPSKIEEMTTQEIADITLTNPTSVIRVAKKMNFNGWSSFKKAYVKEFTYLNNQFDSLDANLPFKSEDSPLAIAGRLAAIEQQTLSDTMSLLNEKELKKAQKFLTRAKEIKLFANFSNALISQDFVRMMKRINKHTLIANEYESLVEAYNSDKNTCAILISYTGQNPEIYNVIPLLKKNKTPIISLTGIGDNPIAEKSDCNLNITTRERLYSKIGNFTSNHSIIYLLDLLYSLVFAANYDKNLEHIVKQGQVTDRRKASSSIMEEDE